MRVALDGNDICNFYSSYESTPVSFKSDINFGSNQKAAIVEISSTDPTGQILMQYLLFSLVILLATTFLFFISLYKSVNSNIVSPIHSIERLLIKILKLDMDAEPSNPSLKVKELNHLLEVTTVVGKKLTRYHQEALEYTSAQVSFEIARQLAHDMRSPISALSIATEYLPQEVKERSLIISAAKRLESLAENFLNDNKKRLTRLDREKQPSPSISLYTFENLLQESVLIKEIEAAHITFQVNIEFLDRDKQIFISSENFTRVISNLFNNSIEANAKKIICNLNLKDNFLKIQIEDDGHGIPNEVLEKVGISGFSHGKNESGFGLGLSHAKRTLESIGGEILIQSAPNEGCKITLSFPVYAA